MTDDNFIFLIINVCRSMNVIHAFVLSKKGNELMSFFFTASFVADSLRPLC